MAGVKVTYKVISEQALKGLTGLDLRCRNLYPVMQDFAGYMPGSVQRTIAVGGRPNKWAPLKLSTMSAFQMSRASFRNKPRKDGGWSLSKTGREALVGRKLLIDKGLLINSIHFNALPRGVEGFVTGPAGRYAPIQQLGAKIPPIRPKNKKALYWPGLAYPVKGTKGGIIPPRPFLAFLNEDINGYLFPRLTAYVEGR